MASANPINRWQARLDEARRLKDQLRYRDAAQLLADLLIDVRRLKGPAVDAYLPVTLGELGECYFQAGDAVKAIAPTRQALEMTARAGDSDGVRAYLGNLYEMHRYLDQPADAAAMADRLADHLPEPDAGRYRRQAALVRAGEPRNRVVVEIHGQRYEVDEVLAGVEGPVRFHFERSKLSLTPAEHLTRRGDEWARQGQYDAALAVFREAAAADPCAPHPTLEAAVVLMHLGRVVDAIDYYARTEELAPAWFHCRSELWLAQQIAAGRYDVQSFLLLRAVEAGGLNPATRRKLIEAGLRQTPDLALLHHQHGLALRDLGQVPSAQAAWREGIRFSEEADIRTRLLVAVATLLDPGDERRRLLDEAIALAGNLVAAATARLVRHFDP